MTEPLTRSWQLLCARCATAHPEGHIGRCQRCAAPVVATPQGSTEFIIDSGAPGIWQYAQVLGLDSAQHHLSLGEALPPVIPLAGQANADHRVYVQLEHLNPTGSFKDRAVAAATGQALKAGRGGIVCASSGNAAASAAAYGARAGMPVVVIVPESTPPGKLAASASYGAIQVTVGGDYSNSFVAAEKVAKELDLANVTTTYINPYGVSALRSVAYDMYRHLQEAPDVVIVPTSAGPLVHGVAEGFADLRSWGQVEKVPRLVAVQPEGCAPIASAWGAGHEFVEAWEEVNTSVSGLDDPLRGYPLDGTVTLGHIRNSSGVAMSVPDAESDQARRTLAITSGIDAEPAGATSVAALIRLQEMELLDPGESVVCLITGHGLKRPQATSHKPLHADQPAQVTNLLSSRL